MICAKLIRTILIIPVIWFGFSCSKEKIKTEEIGFYLNGTSDFVITNNSGKEINLRFDNYSRIPLFEFVNVDTLLNDNESVTFKIVTQGYHTIDLEMDSVFYKVFTSPNKEIRLKLNTDAAEFFGDYSVINNHLLRDKGSYYSINRRWIKYVNATGNINYNFKTLKAKLKAITSENLEEIEQDKLTLPNWYIILQQEKIKYKEAGQLLNALSYRKKMLGFNDSIPKGYIDSIVEGITLKSINQMGFQSYYMFLHDFLVQSYHPLNSDVENDKFDDYYDKFFRFSSKRLDPLIKDYYLSGFISNIISSDKSSFEKSYLSYLDDTAYINLLLNQYNEQEFLPNGSKLPEINLINSTHNSYNFKTLKDSILVINFWASYCKPCIKKFAEQNKLVKKYMDHPVKIISVCIETEFDRFKKLIDQHQLNSLNLFADQNKSIMLQQDFEIRGLPHSVLVNKNFDVIKNRINLEDAEKIIDAYLNEKK